MSQGVMDDDVTSESRCRCVSVGAYSTLPSGSVNVLFRFFFSALALLKASKIIGLH